MIYLKLFWAFFIANVLGYGGGPPSIPLVQSEVVDHYGWMSLQEFANMLAVANALPGPIATKMAAYVGYQVAGIGGAVVTLIATVLPSAIAIVVLFNFLDHFKNTPQVKEISNSIQPVVSTLLAILTYQMLEDIIIQIGTAQSIILIFLSYFALNVKKFHPAIVVILALVFGGIFLS